MGVPPHFNKHRAWRNVGAWGGGGGSIHIYIYMGPPPHFSEIFSVWARRPSAPFRVKAIEPFRALQGCRVLTLNGSGVQALQA